MLWRNFATEISGRGISERDGSVPLTEQGATVITSTAEVEERRHRWPCPTPDRILSTVLYSYNRRRTVLKLVISYGTFVRKLVFAGRARACCCQQTLTLRTVTRTAVLIFHASVADRSFESSDRAVPDPFTTEYRSGVTSWRREYKFLLHRTESAQVCNPQLAALKTTTSNQHQQQRAFSSYKSHSLLGPTLIYADHKSS
jgi:hypothetical protein